MTTETLVSLIGVLFFLLIGILAWIANAAYSKLSSIDIALHQMTAALHDRVTGIDRRVTTIEAACAYKHPRQ